MRQDGRQRSWKPEAVGEHVFGARLAKFLAKPFVAIKDLPDNRLSVRRIDVALLHRGTCRKPSPRVNELRQLGKIRRIIFLHQPIAISSAEVKDVVRILPEKREV